MVNWGFAAAELMAMDLSDLNWWIRAVALANREDKEATDAAIEAARKKQ